MALTIHGNFVAIDSPYAYQERVFKKFYLFLRQHYGFLVAQIIQIQIPKNSNSFTVSEFLNYKEKAALLARNNPSTAFLNLLKTLRFGMFSFRLLSRDLPACQLKEFEVRDILEKAQNDCLEKFIFALKQLRIFEIFMRRKPIPLCEGLVVNEEALIEVKGQKVAFDETRLEKFIERLPFEKPATEQMKGLVHCTREQLKRIKAPNKVALRNTVALVLKSYNLELTPPSIYGSLVKFKLILLEVYYAFKERVDIVHEKVDHFYEKGNLNIKNTHSIIALIALYADIFHLDNPIKQLVETPSWQDLPIEVLRTFYQLTSQQWPTQQEPLP